MGEIYNRYFAKHKPFRHHAQHLLIALVVLIFTQVYMFKQPTPFHIFLYIVLTFFIDIDSLVAVFLTHKYPKYKKDLHNYLKLGKYEEVMIYATTHHKDLDSSIFHTFFSYILVYAILIYSIMNNNLLIGYIFLATFVHMSFDIFDDYYQLGHFKHWMRIM